MAQVSNLMFNLFSFMCISYFPSKWQRINEFYGTLQFSMLRLHFYQTLVSFLNFYYFRALCFSFHTHHNSLAILPLTYGHCCYLHFSADPKKTLHLTALDGAKDRLHLFKASLLEEGSFDAAVHGCDTVFHTASPFYHNVKDPKVCLMET